MEFELDRITLLNNILSVQGAQKLSKLFEKVREVDVVSDKVFFSVDDVCCWFQKGVIFDSETAIRGFIQSRTNAFSSNQQVSDNIRNRTLEYREAMGFLVNNVFNDPEATCATASEILEKNFSAVKVSEFDDIEHDLFFRISKLAMTLPHLYVS